MENLNINAAFPVGKEHRTNPLSLDNNNPNEVITHYYDNRSPRLYINIKNPGLYIGAIFSKDHYNEVEYCTWMRNNYIYNDEGHVVNRETGKHIQEDYTAYWDAKIEYYSEKYNIPIFKIMNMPSGLIEQVMLKYKNGVYEVISLKRFENPDAELLDIIAKIQASYN